MSTEDAAAKLDAARQRLAEYTLAADRALAQVAAEETESIPDTPPEH